MSNKNLTKLIFDISYHISSSYYLPASAMIWPSNPAFKMIFGVGHSHDASAWEYGDVSCTSTMVGATYDDIGESDRGPCVSKEKKWWSEKYKNGHHL